MEEKKTPFNIVGGVLFFVLAAWELLGGINFWGLLYIAAYILVGISLLIRNNQILPVVGFGIMGVASAINMLLGLFRNVNIFTATYFLTFAACGFAAILAYALLMGPADGKKLASLWFLPAVLAIVNAPVKFLSMVVGFGFSPSFTMLLGDILFAAALFFAFMWIANSGEEGFAQRELPAGNGEGFAAGEPGAARKAPAAAPMTDDQAYCGLVKHILLLLFTFGIWYYIWIYRMTGYLNRVEEEPPRTPVYQLLLCMFVPFYLIYWVYISAQRIDRMAQEKGMQSELAVLCLILAIFVSIIPPILMQDKINNIVTAKGAGNTGSYYTAPTPPKKPEAPVVGGADEIKKYKELLDSGIITEEEFETKKKQILGL